MGLKCDAIRFVQNRFPMYLISLPVNKLDQCSIDAWDPYKTGVWKGYQRKIKPKKVRSLVAYLERKDSILPTAGLVNVREKGQLKFSGKRHKSLPTSGVLTIPDYTQLWVVDMQHRLEGLREAFNKGYAKDFSIPVVITEGLKNVDEAAQFYIINTKSDRMSVDLTRRLLIEHHKIRGIVEIPEWELKAVRIAIELNKKLPRNNPWHKAIREPNTEKKVEHIATEKSFIPSLKWLLNAPRFKSKSPRHLAKGLAAMWQGIKLNIPTVFESPKAHLLQKTPGYMAIHRLAPILLRKYKAKGWTPRTFQSAFKPLKDKGPKFWSKRNLKTGIKKYGTGQGAYALIASDLSKILELE